MPEEEVSSAIDRRESAMLAPQATPSAASAGRMHAEPLHPYRGPYERDRDRIVHSAAYRQLAYKTQVFTGALGDYHRTRLTHTLEVASIARTLARALGLQEDLVEALALLHDIGHPPFGHAGEAVLDECLRESGGFNHNAQALRIVTRLETRYPNFPGLNLTRQVLSGQLHRVPKPQQDEEGAPTEVGGLPREVAELRSDDSSPSLEVQVVDVADSIAYDTHDADDALVLGLLTLDELSDVPLWRKAAKRISGDYGVLAGDRLRRATVRQLIDWQVGDVLGATQQRLDDLQIETSAEVRKAQVLAAPSAEMAEQKRGLEQFLFDRVYRHPTVLEHRHMAQAALHELFASHLARPELLPQHFGDLVESEGSARVTADYLAGMTDRRALEEHEGSMGSHRRA